MGKEGGEEHLVAGQEVGVGLITWGRTDRCYSYCRLGGGMGDDCCNDCDSHDKGLIEMGTIVVSSQHRQRYFHS